MIGQTASNARRDLSIRDVSKMCNIPAHTIRYWEKEFKDYLSPSRTPGKQRRYADKDIQHVMNIKQLLWDEKYSIEGARRMLQGAEILSELSSRPGDTFPQNTQQLALQIAHVIQKYAMHKA